MDLVLLITTQTKVVLNGLIYDHMLLDWNPSFNPDTVLQSILASKLSHQLELSKFGIR